MKNKYFACYDINYCSYCIAYRNRKESATCRIIYDGFSSMQEAEDFIKLIIEEDKENEST